MNYQLNRSILVKILKEKTKWPYTNQVLNQAKHFFVNKKTYKLGYWVSAVEDSQLEHMKYVLGAALNAPGYDLDSWFPHVDEEIDDLIMASMVGIGAETKNFSLIFRQEVMWEHMKTLFMYLNLELLLREGKVKKVDDFILSNKDAVSYIELKKESI